MRCTTRPPAAPLPEAAIVWGARRAVPCGQTRRWMAGSTVGRELPPISPIDRLDFYARRSSAVESRLCIGSSSSAGCWGARLSKQTLIMRIASRMHNRYPRCVHVFGIDQVVPCKRHNRGGHRNHCRSDSFKPR